MGQAPSDQLAITVPVVAVSRVVQGAEGAPRVEALEHHAGARRVAMQSSVNSVDALVAPVVVISCSASGMARATTARRFRRESCYYRS